MRKLKLQEVLYCYSQSVYNHDGDTEGELEFRYSGLIEENLYNGDGFYKDDETGLFYYVEKTEYSTFAVYEVDFINK